MFLSCASYKHAWLVLRVKGCHHAKADAYYASVELVDEAYALCSDGTLLLSYPTSVCVWVGGGVSLLLDQTHRGEQTGNAGSGIFKSHPNYGKMLQAAHAVGEGGGVALQDLD